MYTKPAEISTEKFSFHHPITDADNVGEASPYKEQVQENAQLSEYDTDSDESVDGQLFQTEESEENENDNYSFSREDPNQANLANLELNFISSSIRTCSGRTISLSTKALRSLFD